MKKIIIFAFILCLFTGCNNVSIIEKSEENEIKNSTEILSSENSNENAIKIDGENKTIENMKITKIGDGEKGEDGDFYGLNAAVLATNKAEAILKNVDIETDGSYANAVFSYGDGTKINISDSTINTQKRNSGGIMVTGGGELNATNLIINTYGGSSAPIRSDRGGVVLNVQGGTYKSYGVGSPVIYSTADITVENAELYSDVSQGAVIEGKNSIVIKNSNLVGNNIKHNSDKSNNYQAVMIYQSMSGDAKEGKGTFTMENGTLESKNGGMFFVNNTIAEINLKNVELKYATDDFLRIEKAGWGRDGENGGQVTFTANNQNISGNVSVDEISKLNYLLDNNSAFNGAIVSDGETYVELKNGSVWTLTADSKITSLSCDENGIKLNGYKLLIGDEEYKENTASVGETVEIKANSSGFNGEPPEMPPNEKFDGMDKNISSPNEIKHKPKNGSDSLKEDKERKTPPDGDRKEPPEDKPRREPPDGERQIPPEIENNQ